MSESQNDAADMMPRPCPICGKPATIADRPFCSKRCADIDLHRWLKGSYVLPAAPEAAQDDSPSEDLPPRHDRCDGV